MPPIRQVEELDGWVPTDVAARLLGVKERQVRWLAQSGSLPAIRLGGLRRGMLLIWRLGIEDRLRKRGRGKIKDARPAKAERPREEGV